MIWLIIGGVLFVLAVVGLSVVPLFQRVTVVCYRPDVARQAVTAARHAALPPVRVVSVKTVNERKALP